MHAPVVAAERVLAITVKCFPIGQAAWSAFGAVLSRMRSIGPHDVEGVAFRSTTGILNANNRSASISRTADQLLTPASVDAGKAKITRIPRERSRTFKPAPPGKGA
jgi:hypothetical protein